MAQSESADAKRAQYLLDNRAHVFDVEDENAESDISFLYILGENVRSMFTAFIAQHKGLMSPIRRFPPELLVEVFSWVVQESPFPTKHSAAYPYEVALFNCYRALAFTHVCPYWRQVALSRLQLWTSIPFFYRIYSDESQGLERKGIINLVKLYLERSKDFPIHVRVWLPHTGLVEGDPADAASFEPFRSVLAHANRWSTAMIHALKLRVVLPTGPDRIREGDYRGANTVFQTTPMLKTLVLDSKPMLPELSNLLSQLTTFGQRLVPLRMPRTREEFQAGEYELQAAAWRGVYNDVLSLDQDAQPLEVLGIEGPGTIEATTVVRELWGMTLAKPSLLRSFTFHVRDMKRIELLRLLEVMPLLEVLDIWDMPSASLKLLVLKSKKISGGAEPSPPLVPHLHSLTIREFSDPDYKVLEDIYDSRRLSPCPSGEQSTSTVVDRNLTIFLTYHRARGLARYQNIIEGWQEVEPGNHKKGSECTMLLGWANYLVKNFLSFKLWNPACAMKKFEFTGKGRLFPKGSWDVEKIDKFLSVVEGHEMKDGQLLEMTRLYRIMVAIRDQPKGFPLGDEIFSFRARAGVLVKKWTPLVEESQKGRRWQISEDGRTLRLGEELTPRKIDVGVER